MSFVTLTDFETRYGGSIPDADSARIQALLSDACDIAADIMATTYEDGATVPGAVISVIVSAVRRAYDNPMGLTGETVGNYTWQGGRSAGAGIYFTTAEKQTLRRAVGKLGVGQASLEGYLGYVPRAEQYVDTTGSGEAVLYYDGEDLERFT